MTRLRKEVEEMDAALVDAFKEVSNDMNNIMDKVQLLNKRMDNLSKVLKSVYKDQKQFTKVGPVTGKTYTTLNGRVHAIAQHLGLKFEAKPKQCFKAKVNAVKVEKVDATADKIEVSVERTK